MTTQQTKEEVFNIFNGPSKFDASVSLFSGGNGERIPVVLHLRDGEATCAIAVFIEEMGREDGGGESYNFRAYFHRQRIGIKVNSSSRLMQMLETLKSDKGIRGYFDFRSRKGTLRLGFTGKKFQIQQVS